MNRLIAAAALTPMLIVSGALAQTVSEDVTKQLWCGTAFTIAYGGEPPEGLSEEEIAQGRAFFAAGETLVADAEQAHLDAGFTQEAIDTLKTALAEEVTAVISGQVPEEQHKYSFDECVALLPAPAGGAATDASSSAM